MARLRLFPITRASLAADRVASDQPASRDALRTLVIALIPVLGPHALHLPAWCSAFAGLLLAWRAWTAYMPDSAPLKPAPRWLMLLLTAVAIGASFYTHRTLFGRDAGVTFVTALLALKLLETRTRRDVMAAIFLSYFLILTNFFYSQTIATGAVMLVALVLITAALVASNRDAGAIGFGGQVRVAGTLIAQAFPMMLILYVLFPRVQGPLWGLPADTQAAVSGLSESMSPGLITQLSLSDGIAFRVDFSGTPPRAADLYWRGPVLSQFDGRNWRMQSPPMRAARFSIGGRPVDYEVTLEPSNRPWLFALEMPDLLPPYARLTSDLQPVTDKPVTTRLRYRARSWPAYRSDPMESREDLAPYVELPPRSNPRTRELVAGWVFAGADPTQLIDRALAHFRNESFFYTLEPPLLDNNAVDEFLFVSRRGFCEHYASAFVVMMRSARVPARVVTGYQGGEVNPVDGVFTVRQSDAHAWAEVWLRGRGWTRVDPTSAVSPARVERGLAGALPQRFAPPLIARITGRWGSEWATRARLTWEALNNRWNQLVLNYTPDRQRETLERLGMRSPTWQDMVVSMVLGTVLAGGAVALWLFRAMRERDPVQRAWIVFTRRLAKAGYAREPAEGPLDYRDRAASAMRARSVPGSAVAAFRGVTEAYAALRYGPKPDKVAAREFIRLAKSFHP